MNRNYARAAYVVGAALILIPMFDAATSVLPLRFAESRWRYGTIGLLSNSLLIPLAGVAVVFAVALTQGDRRTLRVLGLIAALSSVLTGVAIVTFALDALQSQSGIRADLHLPYIVASTTAGAKLLVSGVALALFAFAGLKRPFGGSGRPGKGDQLFVGELSAKPSRNSGVTA